MFLFFFFVSLCHFDFLFFFFVFQPLFGVFYDATNSCVSRIFILAIFFTLDLVFFSLFLFFFLQCFRFYSGTSLKSFYISSHSIALMLICVEGISAKNRKRRRSFWPFFSSSLFFVHWFGNSFEIFNFTQFDIHPFRYFFFKFIRKIYFGCPINTKSHHTTPHSVLMSSFETHAVTLSFRLKRRSWVNQNIGKTFYEKINISGAKWKKDKPNQKRIKKTSEIGRGKQWKRTKTTVYQSGTRWWNSHFCE